MQDTKARREVEVLQQFYAMLSNDSARAFYGPGHVKAAQELDAIGTLLLTDSVLLVHDVNKVCFSCANTQRPCNMLHSGIFVPSIHNWIQATMSVSFNL